MMYVWKVHPDRAGEEGGGWGEESEDETEILYLPVDEKRGGENI